MENLAQFVLIISAGLKIGAGGLYTGGTGPQYKTSCKRREEMNA